MATVTEDSWALPALLASRPPTEVLRDAFDRRPNLLSKQLPLRVDRRPVHPVPRGDDGEHQLWILDSAQAGREYGVLRIGRPHSASFTTPQGDTLAFRRGYAQIDESSYGEQPNRIVSVTSHGTRLVVIGLTPFWARALIDELQQRVDDGSELSIKPDWVLPERAERELSNVAILYPNFEPREAPPWGQDLRRDEFGLAVDALVAGTRMPMRFCPPGCFAIGAQEDDEDAWPDERPVHEVVLTSAHWLADAPVTRGLWRKVMNRGTSSYADHPVSDATKESTLRFLRELERLVPGFDLPTEELWEYAARAGTRTTWWSGGIPRDLAAAGWFKQNSGGTSHPVRAKPPNPWGFYDVHGGVFERCWECTVFYPRETRVDPSPPISSAELRYRGGGIESIPRATRSATRFTVRDTYPAGLRLARPA